MQSTAQGTQEVTWQKRLNLSMAEHLKT